MRCQFKEVTSMRLQNTTKMLKNVHMRASQMKTLNIFLNIIYCAEVVQSCIAFQHLPHAQCKSSSAYKVHKFL